VWTVVAINAVKWDTYNLYTGGASQYITIPEDGLYFMIGCVHSTTGISAPLGCAIYLNGSWMYGLIAQQSSYGSMFTEISYMYMLNEGDKLDLYAFWAGTGSINIGTYANNCFLQVLKLPYITKGY
jgi:hypothetical protein